jgi:hypothetical protein
MLVLTNPSRSTYEDYAIKQIEDQARSQCDRAPAGFGIMLQGPCRAAISAIKPQLRPLIAASSTCENLILVSICRSNISIPAINFQAQVESLGILDRFYTYKTQSGAIQ